MTGNLAFTAGEMAVDDGLGYPKAYAKLCKDSTFSPYSLSPPFTFLPFAPQQVSRVKEFDEMFPIVDPNAKPSVKPKIFVSLLWNQLNHLWNAGFDPDMFRADPYGNVLYYHADSASPLAWDIDHWFPISRGGLTVPRNLRILQWQVCKKKNNQLEFLIPWWDLQVGISINQFLSIFASSNSDFRHRAFSWLFSQGESEELSNSHNFPQHFIESKNKIGLAPAAVVLGRRESRDTSSILNSSDINTKPRSCIPTIASKKVKSDLKENEESKVSVEELELTLMKKRRDADKCRRLAEAQSSYKVMLEKMIRDAMHQSVVYKEQMRSNQAANNSLMARLEAQRAICNSAEKELHCKYKQRDKLEKQVIRPECEHTRKRSRMDDFLVDNKKNYLTQSQMEMNDDTEELEERGKAVVVEKEENQVEERVQNLEMEGGMAYKFRYPVFDESEKEEDEESRKQRGKGNVEKWLQMLLEENNEEEIEKVGRTDEIIHKLNLKYPHIQIKSSAKEASRNHLPYRIWPRKSNDADESKEVRYTYAIDEHERKE